MLLYLKRQRLDGRRFEQRRHRQAMPQLPLDVDKHLHRQQGMASKVKEVVMYTHLGKAKTALPDGNQLLLQLGRGRLASCFNALSAIPVNLR